MEELQTNHNLSSKVSKEMNKRFPNHNVTVQSRMPMGASALYTSGCNILPRQLNDSISVHVNEKVYRPWESSYETGDKTPAMLEYEKATVNNNWWIMMIVGIGIIGLLIISLI